MTPAQAHFEEFEPHTLLKHAILRHYLERWGRILLMRSRTTLRFVDACAGEGHDEAGNPGSPIIAIEEAREAEEHLSKGRGQRVHIEVVAIEKNRRRAQALESAVEHARRGGSARVFHGTLEHVLPELEPTFPQVPTLFFVDPFGMEPLRADLIRRALTGTKNEVLLLFASQASLRHVGATEAGARALSRDQDLFSASDVPVEIAPHSEADLHRIKGGRRSAEILDAAFGCPKWRGVLNVDRSRRLDWLLSLYEDVLRSFGAVRVLKIPIIDPSRALKYHLVHASKHPRAFSVMKDAAHAAWGRKGTEGSAVRMMRLAAAPSTHHVAQQVLQQFAGARVKWTDDVARHVPSVRRFVLEDTDLWPHQTADLRKLLAPYRSPSRGEYTFPPLGARPSERPY